MNNVKKLQDSITKTKNYLPVLEDNLKIANQKKVNNLVEKQQRKISKLNVAINPKEEFNYLKQVELNKLEDTLYWNLRKEETSFHNHETKDADAKLAYESKLKELFAKYDSDVANLEEKFNDNAFNTWYFKNFKVSTLDLDVSKHIKYYQEELDKLLLKNKEEVANLEKELQDKLETRLAKETEKSKARLEKLEVKLEESLKNYMENAILNIIIYCKV